MTKRQSAWIVFGIVIGMIYGGGYSYLTAEGVETKEFDLQPSEMSDNVRYFQPTGPIDGGEIALAYSWDGTNYSNVDGEEAWPAEGHLRDRAYVDQMAAGDRSYFRGDFFDEESQTIIRIAGVIHENVFYYSRENWEVNHMFPAKCECVPAGDKVVAIYTPDPVEYTVTFTLILMALTVVLSPLISHIISRKKK